MMKLYYVLMGDVDNNAVEKYLHLLPQERRERIARYRYERDRLLALTAGFLVSLAGKGTLSLGEYGKPALPEGEKRFSLAHAGDCVVILIADEEVGVDIEPLYRKVSFSVTRRFHENEQRYIESAADKKRAFLDIWTRKEAYTKRTGTGISVELSSFDVTSPPNSDMLQTFVISDLLCSVCSEHDHEVAIEQISFKELLDKTIPILE